MRTGGSCLPEGNPAARALLEDVFQVTDRGWRGIGVIPDSGWRLAEKYREFDAEYRFEVTGIDTEESTVCRSGEVLQGLIKPHECAAFGKECTPRNPLGATMVSSEGACAAYYLYRRLSLPDPVRGPRRQGGGGCLRHSGRSTAMRLSTSRAGRARCRCGTARTS